MFQASPALSPAPARPDFEVELVSFKGFGKSTQCLQTGPDGALLPAPVYLNEFWTSRQRAAGRLHEISYRACFKPQVPRFFIDRLTKPGDRVYDPFMGRGTTCLEAALMNRIPAGSDINPLSRILLEPRLNPPSLEAIAERLQEIDLGGPIELPEELLTFYHPKTLRAICNLRNYLRRREEEGVLDAGDRWIRMVAVNRLTGHSSGFFSVYTLPPNQAVSIKAQQKINADRQQVPPVRDVPRLILKKSKQLLGDFTPDLQEQFARLYPESLLLTGPADQTPEVASESVDLVVTSPPFLDVVDYAGDNWLRLWFCGIDPAEVRITMSTKLAAWEEAMTLALRELARVLKPSGHIAFEVGEVRAGKVRLEESVLRCGEAAGLSPRLVLINDQEFTKTANCWGVSNGAKGTNTNRVVVFRKDPS